MKKIIWLDDLRNPEDHLKSEVEYSVYWCKSMKEFIDVFQKIKVDEVWFDHDLKPEHYTPKEYWTDYAASEEYQFKQNHKETGYHCAIWMVKHCKENSIQLPIFYSQSANPVGRDRILSLLNWEKKENF